MSDSGGEQKRDIWSDGIQNFPSNSFHNIAAQQNTQGNIFVNQDQYLNHNIQQSPSPTGNYTMLPVGHGNYLKVYHNNDERDDFHKYELFSSTSFIPPHTMINQQSTPVSNQSQLLNNHNDIININDGVSATTSLFLNQLVENLGSQNISGTYSPFGESMTIPQATVPHTSFNTNPMNISAKNEHVIKDPPKSSSDKNISSNINETKIQNKSKSNDTIKKPRIVAEVKPMRMSYSDVLSQNVSLNQNLEAVNSVASTINNNTNGNTNSGTPIKTTKIISDKNKNSFNQEKKVEDRENQANRSSIKKLAGNLQKSNIDCNPTNLSNEKDKKVIQDDVKEQIPSTDENFKNNNAINRKRSNKTNNINSNYRKNNKNNNDFLQSDGKKKKSKLFNSCDDDDDYNEEEDDDDEIDDCIDDTEQCYYNVTKTLNENNIEKIHHRAKRNKTNTNSSAGRSIPNKYEKIAYNKRSQKSRRNRKYVFMVKFLEKWMEYMLKLLSWLLSLVSDVVLLSFGIVVDRLNIFGQYILQMFYSIRNELKTNSGFSTNWFKKMYKKFDGKFAKTSRWAIWRKIFLKKKVIEPVSDFYKNGRLPQTGDEAMYSLLNCKGKDAYSILGVSSDCAQEQIRKHYKKIAVLVHPDKNKQPGAEEAFKILQRAFELIGEPENRKAYDQSVAEALNAEKAWSELNDLLAQLHTKIAEAANTIRCSSCGLRHPRKPTGRPHYAARECNSCKIRHSAREGDIWAETSFFGLRWKYLALMEGTVYDITEWANCQKGALSHLQPNSHIVQYRIVLGGQQQQNEKEKIKKTIPTNEPNLDEFLNNLYGGPNQQQNLSSRRRSKKN